MDDMGYSDLSSFGGEIPTPNIDALAQQGVKFRQFYNGGKCEPTRASLMSGQYWTTTGLGVKKGPTLGEVLQSADYRTYAIGKWHLDGNPTERGFNHFFGHLSGATDLFRGNKTFRLDKQAFTPNEDFYATVDYTNYAIDFINEGLTIAPDKPFFLYLAHTAPHSPMQALPKDIEKFENAYSQGWDILREQRITRMRALKVLDEQWEASPRPNTIPSWDTLTEQNKAFEAKRMAIYAAMIYRVDQELARLIDVLKSKKQLENTLVIFMSDNGASPFDRVRRGEIGTAGSFFNVGIGWAWMSGAPFKHYKRNQYQGGILTSAIVNWPAGISEQSKGRMLDSPKHIIDLLPTFMAASGARYQTTFKQQTLNLPPGQSLLPELQGQSASKRDALYFQLFDHWAMIEDGYKIASDWGRPPALFDLTTDRTEMNNLAEAEPMRLQRMQQKWQRWASQHGKALKTAGDEPKHWVFPGKGEPLPPRKNKPVINKANKNKDI